MTTSIVAWIALVLALLTLLGDLVMWFCVGITVSYENRTRCRLERLERLFIRHVDGGHATPERRPRWLNCRDWFDLIDQDAFDRSGEGRK